MCLSSTSPTPPTPHKSVYADDPMMQPLLTEFTGRLAGQVQEIRKAIAAEDAETLRRILHQLKGSGRSYGFGPISSHAAAAEEKLKAELPIVSVYSDVSALIDYIEHIENYRPA